jgi:signal transduction histidine kinase
MLYARRAARFFERLANPDEQSQAPKGVLLYSPNLLRFVAVLCYVILLLGYINNFFISDFFRRSFSDATMREIFYAQSVLVFIGAIGTGLVVYFARTHYRACMLFASMLAVSSSMVAIAFMYGLNVNPHLLLAVTPLLLIGFTVGRDGLLLVTLWIVANYVFLYLGDAWGWWPRPLDTTVDIVKHENLSAFIIVLLIVAAVEFYIVKIAVTLRKQGELHRALEEDQQERVELLSRLVTAKDEERQQLAHALHEGPMQDLVALRYGVWNAMDRVKLVEIIDAATLKLRTVSRDLHPAAATILPSGEKARPCVPPGVAPTFRSIEYIRLPSATRQSFIRPSFIPPTDASVAPSGEKATASTEPVCPLSTYVASPGVVEGVAEAT